MDMQGAADVMKGSGIIIEALAWPLLAAYVTYMCLPSIIKIVRSKEFTIKVGDLEISVQQASDEIKGHLKDLHEQMATLRAQMPQTPSLNTISETAVQIAKPERRPRILWVTGKFEYHAYELANIRDCADVDTVTSTSEAIVKLKSRRYDAVISGMSRAEKDEINPTAGLTLIEEARAIKFEEPIYIFCSAENVRAYGNEAMAKGAQGATASTVQLYEWLKGMACQTSMQEKVEAGVE